jgi:hypothetical protein
MEARAVIQAIMGDSQNLMSALYNIGLNLILKLLDITYSRRIGTACDIGCARYAKSYGSGTVYEGKQHCKIRIRN